MDRGGEDLSLEGVVAALLVVGLAFAGKKKNDEPPAPDPDALAEDGWLLGLHEFDVTAHKPWMCERRGTHPLYFINQDQVVELPRD